MRPEVLVFLIPIFGILLGMLAVFLKHREKMAGLDGERGSQTVQLLTDTLEKQHERIQSMQKRIETLEMIVTDENAALAHQAKRTQIEAGELPESASAVPTRTRTST